MSNAAACSARASALALLDDFSLEMTGKDVPALREAQPVIPPGTRINVTYLAGEDSDTRVAAAQAVRELGFVPVPHISARRLRSRAELEELLARLQEANAEERVFVVGGDPSKPDGPYPDALSVIRSGFLEAHGVREVGVAGYPEGHPDIPTETLWNHLEGKAVELRERGLGAVVITQFGFDTGPTLDWILDVRRRGMDAQLRIGVPGPADIKRLLGFARRFGIGANAMIAKKYGFSLTNLIGAAGPDRFVTELSSLLVEKDIAGAVKVHIYAFGGLQATAEWARRFSEDRSVQR